MDNILRKIRLSTPGVIKTFPWSILVRDEKKQRARVDKRRSEAYFLSFGIVLVRFRKQTRKKRF